MKRTFLILALLAMAGVAHGQGTLTISVPANRLQFRPNFFLEPLNVPANGGFVSVLWAPQGSPASPQLPFQNLSQWLAANPAWKTVSWDGSINSSALVKPITLSGRLLNTGLTVPTTSAIDLILIGWIGTAPNFDAAFNQPNLPITGFSDVLRGVIPAVAPAPPTQASFPSLTLGILIPEPSTFALATVGVAALLLARRREPSQSN